MASELRILLEAANLNNTSEATPRPTKSTGKDSLSLGRLEGSVTIPARESLMGAKWEVRGLAYNVIEERWKTFDQDGEMISESVSVVSMNVSSRWFGISTNWPRSSQLRTLDHEIGPGFVLDIDGHGIRVFDIGDNTEYEVTA